MGILNYDCMRLDNAQKRQIKEFICFKLDRDENISFKDLNKFVGISQKQWEVFCLENKEKIGEKLKSF